MVEGSGWIELADGDEFAGYRIERRLGRGGMGILYLAVEPGLDRRVALKLIAPGAAADDVFAKRFAEESRIAASIEHPNVVPIYAAGEESGVPFIAMRYVAGSDLGRRLAREGRIEPARAVELIAQIGNGLDAIHAAGLVHRDVKPANVLLGGDEAEAHAYITDFGVARNVATQSGLTQTGRFVGTLDYVAPEQISGGEIDARVDVYALGCLLYKLLTGEVPFPRDGEAARLYAHLHDPPPAPSLYVPEVSMALDDVVARAMSKPAGDRYPSAGDLGRAAIAALSGTAVAIPERTVATGAAATRESEVVAPAPPPPPPPTEPTRRVEEKGRRRGLLAGGLALGLGAAVAVAAILLGGGGGEDPSTATGQTTVKDQGGGEQTQKQEKPKPEPDRLTSSQLVTQGDRICERSQDAFKQTREELPEAATEETPDVEYAKQLVANSSRQVREMEKLVPPKSKQDEFDEYLESREEVAGWDWDALAAAKAGDILAYQEAFDNRNDTEDNRTRMAEAIGFQVCSGSTL
ncbi:MAG TPA: serine/threonine-protein kinase [Solirubrobacterales bacterium]|nr:serine/threonine-protein kinase [Solirubrobacterales bacterium]